MPFDSAALHIIIDELHTELVGGRIDKIHQLSKEQLRLNIRTKAGAKRLLLSASANNSRVHLTKNSAVNPMNPPMFCMMLRKRIGGGLIVDVKQYNLERILEIVINARDELGRTTSYTLRHEIMGRHSNIILCNGDEIVDSIKRIDEDKSRVRQVLPKLIYEYPPKQDKLDPFMMDKNAFHQLILDNGNLSCTKLLNKNILGISTVTARYLGYGEIDMERLAKNLSGNEIDKLATNLSDFYLAIKSTDVKKYLILDAEDKSVKDFILIDKLPVDKSLAKEFTNANELVDKYYDEIELLTQLKQQTSRLMQSLKNIIKRTNKKLMKQQAILDDTANANKYKLYGELLTAYQAQVPKGAKEVELINYYSEDGEKVNVPLNAEKNANVNAQLYFKKYQKLNRAMDLSKVQIVETKAELDYLESMEHAILNCGDLSAAKEILDEFTSQGYIKKPNKKDRRKFESSKPRHYISKDGFDIYVGRNNIQNDIITMKHAKEDDIFLHTQKIPGSHVIIKAKNGIVSKQAVNEGVTLAAYFSKAQTSSNVPVDYTKRKNIKKPNGSKPGYVIYSTHSSMNVTPSLKLINEIKSVDN